MFKVVLYGITQLLCYFIKYEKNEQLISRYKYPFLKIFYRKVKRPQKYTISKNVITY